MNGSSRFLRGLLTVCIVGAVLAGIVYLFAVLARAPVRQPLDSPLPQPPIPTAPVATPTVLVASTITPTNAPQPTVTALPIQNPASDASGTLVYYMREDERAAIYAFNMDKQGMKVGDEYRVTQGDRPRPGLVHPSPDGSRLAIEGDWNAIEIVDVATGKSWPLFAHVSNPQDVPNGLLFLNWHPDNRHVLIWGAGGNSGSGLWLVNTDTSEITLLSHQQFPSDIRDGAVSPDGQKVVFSIQPNTGDTGVIWIANSDGSKPTPVISMPMAGPFGFTWSPDGKYFAFVSDGLKVADADGSNVRTLTQNFAGGLRFEPVWSPDNSTLAFITWDGPGAFSDKQSTPEGKDTWEQWDYQSFKGTNIHLVDVKSGQERRLLPDTGNIDPAWSPDGKQIAFASTRSGNSEIWVINADGTNLRQVTNTGQRIRYPYWRKSQTP